MGNYYQYIDFDNYYDGDDVTEQVFDIVRSGDLEALEEYLEGDDYVMFLDRVTPDLDDARVTYMLSCGVTYFAALQGGLSKPVCIGILKNLLSEMSSMKTRDDYCGHMKNISRDFCRAVNAKGEKIHSAVVARAESLIEKNLYKGISLEDLASQCGCSTSNLQHRFREETGRSVSQYMKEKKILQAAELLKDTLISCADISYSLGYSSQSYFCKQFREIMGVTPTRFRSRG